MYKHHSMLRYFNPTFRGLQSGCFKVAVFDSIQLGTQLINSQPSHEKLSKLFWKCFGWWILILRMRCLPTYTPPFEILRVNVQDKSGGSHKNLSKFLEISRADFAKRKKKKNFRSLNSKMADFQLQKWLYNHICLSVC